MKATLDLSVLFLIIVYESQLSQNEKLKKENHIVRKPSYLRTRTSLFTEQP